MKRLYIYCEGQTEESFVKKLLVPYLYNKEIISIPIICRTKESPKGIHKGGISDYDKAVKEINRLCNMHKNETVTSFIDYYGLHNLPQQSKTKDKYTMIENAEQQFKKAVNCDNFIPYIALHEFESLLFSDPDEFAYLDPKAVPKLHKILNDFDDNPELINNGITTAPSKRILNVIPHYGKVIDGNIIAQNITLRTITQKCRHFKDWLAKLENI